jgi:hypothetical protein
MSGHVAPRISVAISTPDWNDDGKMRLLPGATGANATKRDGYDAGAAAAMTIDEFERWFVRAICLYHAEPHAGLGGYCAGAGLGRGGSQGLWFRSASTKRLSSAVSCHGLSER